jgi:hypothetical protein
MDSRTDKVWTAASAALFSSTGMFFLVIASLATLWWFFGDRGGQGTTSESLEIYQAGQPDRTQQCSALTGTPEQRMTACLKELSPFQFSADALAKVSEVARDGKVLVVGDAVALPSTLSKEQVGLLAHKEWQTTLLDTDEEKAADLLRKAGVRGMVVHRDVSMALDRDKTVLSRLAHHSHLEWFQLYMVTKEAYIYSVRGSRSRISLTNGERLLAGLRQRLAGQPVIPQEWNPRGIQLIGSARLQGSTLILRHSQGSNVEKVLDELAAKIKKRWEREVATEGVGLLRERLGEVRLEVHIVMERAIVEPRSAWQIFDIWEPGIDGVMFRHKQGVKNQKFSYMPGSEMIIRSMKGVEDFFSYTVKKFGWKDSHPWRDANTRLDLIRTQHFAEKNPGGGQAMRLYRGMPEEPMSSLTDSKIRDMLVDGAEWWLENMQPDGHVNYKFWPSQNRLSTDYNEVRHILATRDLSDAWRYRRDPRYLEGAERAMEWLLKYQVHDTDPAHPLLPHPSTGSMLFRYPFTDREVFGKAPNQKLGTVAVALLGWVAWAEATGDHSRDTQIRKMAQFVLSQAESNGKFQAYYVHGNHGYYNNKNDIVPGEAALALGEVAEYFDELKWVEFFPKFLDYYEPWFRSRAKKKNQYGRWPHHTYENAIRLDLVQFGPWSVMANKQYYHLTGDERAAAFGLEVADWMIDNYQWTEERTPFPDYVGGYYKMPTELPAMQTFCYSEGTAAAYQIASRFKPEVKDKYDISTREAIRFLRVMQFDEYDSYFAAQPELIHGGIKYAMNEQKIRIDYVGHGLSTLSQYLDARAYDPAATLDVKPVEVSYSPAHEAIWGTWQLTKVTLHNVAAMSPEEQSALNKKLQEFARVSSLKITPDGWTQIVSGRRDGLRYQVVGNREGVLTLDLQESMGPHMKWMVAMEGDEMVVRDERAERRYRRTDSSSTP